MKRWLVIGLTALVLLLVRAHFGLRIAAQRWIGGQLQTSLKLSERPSVSLHGFPFLLHLAQGRFPTASVSGTGQEAQGITFQSVQITLTGLAFPPSKLVSGSNTTIHAASGEGTVTMTSQQATAALHDQGIDVTVEFVQGEVRLRSSVLPGELRAELALSGSGSKLVLRTLDQRPPLSVAVPLPSFVNGLRFTDVRVVDSTAILSFTLDHPTFRLGTGNG